MVSVVFPSALATEPTDCALAKPLRQQRLVALAELGEAPRQRLLTLVELERGGMLLEGLRELLEHLVTEREPPPLAPAILLDLEVGDTACPGDKIARWVPLRRTSPREACSRLNHVLRVDHVRHQRVGVSVDPVLGFEEVIEEHLPFGQPIGLLRGELIAHPSGSNPRSFAMSPLPINRGGPISARDPCSTRPTADRVARGPSGDSGFARP